LTIIGPAHPEEWSTALELLQGPVDAQTRRIQVFNGLRLLASGELDPEGLLVARGKRAILGVELAVALAGNGGVMWPPQVRHPPDWELQNRLAAAGLEFLRQRGVKVAHAILPDFAQAGALIRAGLAPMTHLAYFKHDLTRLPPVPQSEWDLVSFDPVAPARFQEVLLATYAGTLDCPELNDTRTADEIVAGHVAQGDFRAERWQLAEKYGAAIGVVMATALKDSAAWDLSYMGVVPQRRGQGWGKSLIGWALRAAKLGTATELQVAVDQRNLPALGLYRALGFVEVGRRVVLYKVLTAS